MTTYAVLKTASLQGPMSDEASDDDDDDDPAEKSATKSGARYKK